MSDSSKDQGRKKGSASDHLANERTYLAWIRTSIGLIAFGFVIVKFSLFVKQLDLFSGQESIDHGQGYANILGLLMVIFGGLILLLSYMRYISINKQLESGVFRSRNNILAFLTGGILLAVILLIIYLSVYNL